MCNQFPLIPWWQHTIQMTPACKAFETAYFAFHFLCWRTFVPLFLIVSLPYVSILELYCSEFPDSEGLQTGGTTRFQPAQIRALVRLWTSQNRWTCKVCCKSMPTQTTTVVLIIWVAPSLRNLGLHLTTQHAPPSSWTGQVASLWTVQFP